MNIIEFFENLKKEVGVEIAEAHEELVYEMYTQNPTEWKKWLAKYPEIDIKAYDHERDEYYIVLWNCKMWLGSFDLNF